MRRVVIGFLGSTLDRRSKAERWDKWRPTISVCQHEDLLISRFHLLYPPRDIGLAKSIKADLAAVSPETEVCLEALELRNPWDFEEVFSRLLDYSRRFPFQPEEEEYLLHITTGTHVAQICLFLLTEAGFFPGKLLQTGPGRHNSPPGTYEIIALDLSKYDSIAKRFAQQMHDDISFLKSGINTRNPRFNRLIQEIEKVALRSSTPILLTGPTGAGKSRLARQIFALKKRQQKLPGEFIEVNCATLRGDTAMSTLFGHRKGAYTGAAQDRTGLLKVADGGVLFLDEIGELGGDEQAMLLRAIEEKRFLPMGTDREEGSEFQLICGTNRDLGTEVHRGLFREDLFARIKFWSFRLPGLAERREDIEPNIEYELLLRSRECGKPVTFNREALRTYLDFAMSAAASWPANFRDLNSSIQRMAVMSEGNRIGREDVIRELERLTEEWQSIPRHSGSTRPQNDTELSGLIGEKAVQELDLFDQIQLIEVINICRSAPNLAEAGRRLFAESRQRKRATNDSDRLRKYLHRFGITWEMLSGRPYPMALR
jgi:transcriptional regulatory protein RtcR